VNGTVGTRNPTITGTKGRSVKGCAKVREGSFPANSVDAREVESLRSQPKLRESCFNVLIGITTGGRP